MTSDDMPNFEAALGVEYTNLAARGRKEHPARRLSDDLALVIFFGTKHSSVHLWDLRMDAAMPLKTSPSFWTHSSSKTRKHLM